MRILRAGIAAAMLAAAVPAAGQVQDPYATQAERFQLFSECAPMQVWAGAFVTDADAVARSLTNEALRATAESRLRAARLYADAAPYGLSIAVNVTGPAFSIGVDFDQWLLNPSTRQQGWARTWTRGSVGTHGNDAGYIRSFVAEYLDQFLADYLRVNESACQ